MNNRRSFFQAASGLAIPLAAIATARPANASDGQAREFLGAWNTVHSLPFPPGFFREFLTFSPGGGLKETNSFLNLANSQDLSAVGLPKAVKASDGQGNWERRRSGEIEVVFRKLLFNGEGVNFGDLKVTGTLQISGLKLKGEWLVTAVDPNDKLLVSLGPATSEGTLIR